jgi:hypothetical protein
MAEFVKVLSSLSIIALLAACGGGSTSSTPQVRSVTTPTVTPTAVASAKPTAAPTVAPTSKPTAAPTTAPTAKPTATPTPAPFVVQAGVYTGKMTGKITGITSTITISLNAGLTSGSFRDAQIPVPMVFSNAKVTGFGTSSVTISGTETSPNAGKAFTITGKMASKTIMNGTYYDAVINVTDPFTVTYEGNA